MSGRFVFGQSSNAAGQQRSPEYTFKIVHEYPHDPAAFTQGLAYRDGFLYEGTGLNGRSSLRKVRLETGEVVQHIDLPAEFFGEGITIFKNEVLQLTWQSHVGFVYNLSDFKLQRRFSYPGEGWGLTANEREIFMSDGSAQIRVLDPKTFAEKRRFTVHDGAAPIDQVNELEWVEGEIFANIWQTERIARISPQSGKVVGWIDLTGLLSPVIRRPEDAVLNGIAYDANRKRLFVTGKLWPNIFQIRLVPKHKQIAVTKPFAEMVTLPQSSSSRQTLTAACCWLTGAKALMDLLMMVLTSGRERTEPEFRSVLQEARFSMVQVIRSAGVTIIESRPVQGGSWC